MYKRKICIVTGTRAEYGLFYWLLKEIQLDIDLDLQIIATGMHLSSEFGLTYRTIEADGFVIDAKVEMLLSGDSAVAVTKSVGLATIGFAEAFERLKPDIVVILGDRTEVLAAAQAAMIACIPIAHLHGGEVTEGAIDEAIRHSITKMAHLHFVAAESYRLRVIQLGEQSDRVFQYGALGIENIKRLPSLNREQLEKALNFKMGQLNLLITYHPVTLEDSGTKHVVTNLLHALDEFPEAHIMFTKPNSDAGGRIIIEMLQEYADRYPHRVKVFASMGQVNYLNVIQHCDVVIGNSSSGLIEAPVFKKPTINIGSRQKGRLKADSVLDCEETSESIAASIHQVLSIPFQRQLKSVISLYGEGKTSFLIKEKLKHVDLTNILQKKFNDL
jgi:UDP-hydrolysing UDP-N-acetyl-D-glucosamine 2-epimerase